MIIQIFESIKLALSSITTNKLRSILTLLGIAIGLFSIIIVMTAISAIQQNIEDVFNSIGTNNFIIRKYPALQFGPHDHNKYRNRKNLTVEIGQKLKEITTLPKAIGISMGNGGRVVKFNNEKTNPEIYVWGANVDEVLTYELTLKEGRTLSKADVDYNKPVCVIGYGIYEKFFQKIDPIGKQIKVDNYNFQIIGVYNKRGNVLGQSQDNYVVIPLGVFQKVYGERRTTEYTVMARNKDLLEATLEEVVGALRTLRKVPPGKENDFEIITNEQLIEQFNDLTKYFKLGAFVVAVIALIAAGVGIMNIMLVSVTERTKEIGIRKAIGATKLAIRWQFIVEAVVLSQVGGLIGILAGLIGGNFVALLLGVNVIVPVLWIIIGLLVTSFVGVLFGVYPAIKASNLDPIEALRYE
ncbi:ABC transporter permease [Melioribacteraceae bacterium 4301-Me]|uniref:ABC transporter permease n=1 Tax=Pyranulibacter aquaticus TaxID=3163344 RepID=UPI003594F47E